jgi:hypothetical protein
MKTRLTAIPFGFAMAAALFLLVVPFCPDSGAAIPYARL